MSGASTSLDGLAAVGSTPIFPPRLRGEEAGPGEDVMARAIQRASLGIDPGLIVWHAGGATLEAAVVLAPEQPLEDAMGALMAATLGIGDAIGALAPPEVALHVDWPAGLRVNGGRIGGLRAAASTADPAAEPDWLVIALSVAFLPPGDPARTATGDVERDETGLMVEGCGEITPVALLESWSRHMLVWLNRFESDGLAPLHRDWTARAWRVGEAMADGRVFVGLDEKGGLLARDGEGGTVLTPLSAVLEPAP